MAFRQREMSASLQLPGGDIPAVASAAARKRARTSSGPGDRAEEVPPAGGALGRGWGAVWSHVWVTLGLSEATHS